MGRRKRQSVSSEELTDIKRFCDELHGQWTNWLNPYPNTALNVKEDKSRGPGSFYIPSASGLETKELFDLFEIVIPSMSAYYIFNASLPGEQMVIR